MKGECYSNYFLIAILIVFFMLLYVYVGPSVAARNSFTNRQENYSESPNKLFQSDKIAVIQGNGVPDKDVGAIVFDQNDPAAQSVDGTEKAPKSLFTFAYNKCDVKCCGESPYSCNGGCVCMTDEQKKAFINVGKCAL